MNVLRTFLIKIQISEAAFSKADVYLTYSGIHIYCDTEEEFIKDCGRYESGSEVHRELLTVCASLAYISSSGRAITVDELTAFGFSQTE